MNAVHPSPPPEDSIVELVPVVRRVVAARVVDPATRDDIVQETLARLMASRSRVEHDSLVPYAIATLATSSLRWPSGSSGPAATPTCSSETDEPEPRPDDELLRQEEALLVGAAMARLSAGRAGDPARARGGGYGYGHARGRPWLHAGCDRRSAQPHALAAARGVPRGAEWDRTRRPTGAGRC